MAFDGITISNIVFELNNSIKEGRINKIAQPEKDELQLTVKCSDRTTRRLLISANASLPLIYLTSGNKPSPMTAPNFCMLLRKHLNGCRILDIKQIGLERAVLFELEHLDEMGDLCTKYLFVELMGKHSNIIFCKKDENNDYIIIDSIKRINSFVSSVREVLPGRKYFIPNTQGKADPYEFDISVMDKITSKNAPIHKAIYLSLTGFSPVISYELCERAGIDADTGAGDITTESKLSLYSSIDSLIRDIKKNRYRPCIIYENNRPIEFSVIDMTCYSGNIIKYFDSVSEMLETYYAQKEISSRIHQRSIDMRKTVSTILERDRKKLDLQLKQLKDTEKRDKYRIYGELLTTYGYSVETGEKSLTCNNYYTNEDITIPLDPDMTPIDNAKKYFDKYAKMKRTYEALTVQTEQTSLEIMQLESISNSIDIAQSEADLNMIKKELRESGFIKKSSSTSSKNKKTYASEPLHYITSDGFHVYVGKNNYQNDELTFTDQGPYDWWFHSKKIAGSHVVLRGDGREIPDRSYEEAARLAAYYSKGRDSGKIEIDYTELKNVNKPK